MGMNAGDPRPTARQARRHLMTVPMALLGLDYGGARWSSELLAKVGLVMGAVMLVGAVALCLRRHPVGPRMPLALEVGAGVLAGVAMLAAPGHGLPHVVLGAAALGLTGWLAWDQREVTSGAR